MNGYKVIPCTNGLQSETAENIRFYVGRINQTMNKVFSKLNATNRFCSQKALVNDLASDHVWDYIDDDILIESAFNQLVNIMSKETVIRHYITPRVKKHNVEIERKKRGTYALSELAKIIRK